MADESFKILFDDSEITAGLDKIEKQLKEVDSAAEQVGEQMTDSFAKGEQAADNFTKSLETNAKQVSNQAQAINTAQKANQNWLSSIKQTILGQQIGGKSIGEWGQKAKEFAASINFGTKAVQGMTTAQRIFNTVLAASGIGLIIAAVAGAIGYFTRFQSGIDKASQAMAAFDAVIDELLQRYVKLATATFSVYKGLYSIITLDFDGAMNNFSDAADSTSAALSGLGSALVDAATSGAQLEAQFQALRDETIRANVFIARQQVQVEQLKAAVDNEAKSYGSRIEAQKSAATIEQSIAQKRFDLAKEDLRLKQLQLDRNEEDGAARQAEAEAQKNFSEAEIALNSVKFESEQKIRELRKAAADERKKQLEDERKALEKLNADLEKLRLAALGEGLDAELFQVNQKFDQLAKTAEEGIAKFKEIESRRALTPDELAKKQEFADLEVKIEDQRLGALLDVIGEFAEKDAKIEEEQQKRKEALAAKDLEAAKTALENTKKLQDERIALQEQQNEAFLLKLKASGAKEQELKEAKDRLDEFTQAARLQNELEFQQGLLSLTEAGDTATIAQIEATIATIQQKIKNLQIDTDGAKKPKSIAELLGLNDDEAKAIGEATNQILDSINQIAQARIDAAAKVVQAIDEEISKSEERVKKQEDLAKQGLANDLNVEKERLKELKKQRDAAAKEEAKAKRAAILLDSIAQVSNLITASTKIFNSLAGIPFVGVPLAVGLIAAMFGAFIAAKARALKAAEQPKLKHGGKLRGFSHEEGGIPIMDPGGRQIAEGEGGEWVINKQDSTQQDKFLQRVNKGEFRHVNLHELLPPSGSYYNPASASASQVREMNHRKSELSDARHWAALKAAYSESSERIVSAIESKETVYPWKGGYKTKRKKGNVTHTETVIPAD